MAPATGDQMTVPHYYQDEDVTIYHGDSRVILPSLDPVGLILTDPPWPLTRDVLEGSTRAVELWSEVCPLFKAKRMLIWIGIHYDPRMFLNPLADWPYLRAIYIRRAVPGHFGRVLMDGEAIFALGEWPASKPGARVIPGGIQITYRSDDRVAFHPCPRSLIATRWLVKWWSEPEDVILDPFMGSGTTLYAAKYMGRKSIGIEVNEKYCELTAQRLSQRQLELSNDHDTDLSQAPIRPNSDNPGT